MKTKAISVETDYLYTVYSPHRYKNLIKETVKKIKAFQKKNPFDAIAFRGSSGAALAFPLADKLNVGLIHIRKDKSHYRGIYEGVSNIKSYIIVDDVIETGKTIKKIIKHVAAYNDDAELKAIFLYNTNKDTITDNISFYQKKIGQPNCEIYSTRPTVWR